MKEWLPINARNRVALLFAFVGLVMFVVWNCLPNYEYPGDTDPDGIVAMSLWHSVLRPGFYIMVFKDPDIEGFLGIAACISLIQNALVTLAIVPLWKLLHASPYVRLPLAIVNLLGGCVILWHIQHSYGEFPPYRLPALLLMALSMFSISAAFFLFRNELALREERSRPREG